MTIWEQDAWIRQTSILLNSYKEIVGRELIERSPEPRLESQRLFEAPMVVVSHGLQVDPILNYGNAQALALWEMPVEQFTETPSRKTAEAPQRDERAQMLAEAAEKGYINNYRGVRISSTGKRFQIEQAVVWRLLDSQGQPAGQAATFSQWRFL